MSFQNFRLQATPTQPTAQNPAHDSLPPGSLLHSIPLSVHHQQPHQPHNLSQSQPDQSRDNHPPSKESTLRPPSKAPYGSGDAEDGYTLLFDSMAAFERWREKEEEEKVVEFVKGDTHGSKAVPPRFKDHTKLVCARHQRSGRKKYVKKYPERQRKVPSRKLDGTGCQASISYKTYFDTDEVRVSYNDQHSHEVGESNLPYTRRGRRIEVARQKYKSGEDENPSYEMSPTINTRSNNARADPQPQVVSHAPMGPSQHQQQQQHLSMGMTQHSAGILAPVSNQITHPPPVNPQPERSQERWDRLDVLFQSVRNHARNGYEYPGPSVVTLETVLIRLYLESPVGSGGPPTMNMNMNRGFGTG